MNFYKEAMAEKQVSEKVKKERELIKRIQDFDDKSAMKELMTLYKGMMRTHVEKSGVLMHTDRDTAMMVAENIVKNIVKNKYKLNMPNQPGTYIFANLSGELQKYKDNNSETLSRRPQEETGINRLDRFANKWLNTMGLEDSPEASNRFIKDELKMGGARTTSTSIAKTRGMERTNLSGDRGIGGSDAEGADFVSFSEMFSKDPDEQNSDDLFRDFFKKQEIERAIKTNNFTRGEKKFIMQLAGIGEYQMKPVSNKNQAAINAGITYNEGNVAIKKLQKIVKG